MSRARIFISYSHADEAWKDRLARHLRVLELEGELSLWDDRRIDTGDDWLPEIETALETADVAVLLVSADFLVSDFIRRQEVPRLLARRAAGGVWVVPVIVEPCPWEAVGWLARLQCWPRDARVLSAGDEHRREADLAELALEVRRLLGRRGAGPRESRPPVAAAAGSSRVFLSRLPTPSSAEFVGRQAELARLDAAWEDPHQHLVSLVAWGGVGKSTLVHRWLASLAAAGWRGAERVYGWSFYSQGSTERLTSADAFIDHALRFFGDPDPAAGSARDRGLRLAERVRSAKTLLVLDGLEPLQEPPDSALAGRLKDPALAALVKELALANPGLCVLTTREAVAEIGQLAASTAPRVDLDELVPADGAALLAALGVRGLARELEEVAAELGGHALALTLLGTYLRKACGGEVRRWREVDLGAADARQGGHAFRVMGAYARWLGEGPEVAILRLLGLFDRPAEAAALAALRRAPAIEGLSESLVELAEEDWQWALASLRECGLVAAAEAPGSGVVDAHPLVRACFGEALAAQRPAAWRSAHARLYEHFRQAAPERPDTLEAMLPLYAAVVHGCRAGRQKAAYDEVYGPRIRRGDEHYQLHKLGAFGADLVALAGFFERPWSEPVASLPEDARAWLLNQAGFELRALGRLVEAVQPMRAGLEARIVEKNWKQAAISAGNLSELHMTLGEVAQAVAAGEKSVELADRSGDAFWRMGNRTTLADALHQAGRWEASAAASREAEAMQAKRQPQTPRLYSLPGYQFCDLLLSQGEPADGSGLEGVRWVGLLRATWCGAGRPVRRFGNGRQRRFIGWRTSLPTWDSLTSL